MTRHLLVLSGTLEYLKVATTILMEVITPQMGRADGMSMSDPDRFNTAASAGVSHWRCGEQASGIAVTLELLSGLEGRDFLGPASSVRMAVGRILELFGSASKTGVSICGCSLAELSTAMARWLAAGHGAAGGGRVPELLLSSER